VPKTYASTLRSTARAPSIQVFEAPCVSLESLNDSSSSDELMIGARRCHQVTVRNG
jgi:hypothetical protein